MNYTKVETDEVSLDEFVKYSIWPGRITGEYEWEIPERDFKKVSDEYEGIKYEQLLNFVKKNDIETYSEIREKQLDMTNIFNGDDSGDNLICYSQQKRIYKSALNLVFELSDRVFVECMSNVLSGNEIIIELGSGYGRNLNLLNGKFPNCTYIGGDFSNNAIEISDRINHCKDNISVEHFNYYNNHWAILDNEFDKEVVLFTRHSIEQLPEANKVIHRLVEQLPKNIREILHFEPIYTMNDPASLLGLLRRGYTRINDYNRDLYRALHKNIGVEIVESHYDVFGSNVLNPTSLVRWKLYD
jgi:tRNA G46 methylase TrmB